MFTLEKNPWFTAFLDSNLHTRLAIVTENELGLAFPPRNLPKKFRADPSTFYLVIVVTNKQTDRQTNAGDYIIPRESFRGDNDDDDDDESICTVQLKSPNIFAVRVGKTSPQSATKQQTRTTVGREFQTTALETAECLLRNVKNKQPG